MSVAAAASKAGRATVAVIDDDAITREFVTLTLADAGFETAEADDGLKGIELCWAKLPDVVVLDVVMGGMDGYAAVTALRQNPATSAIPIILVTAAADRRGMRRGMALGADDFLQKPFSSEEVVTAVRSQLKKRAAQRVQAEGALRELQRNMTMAFPHEFNTPLNGIIGCAEMLSEGGLVMEEVPVMAKCILESARRLQRQSDRFLFFASLEIFARSADEGRLILGTRATEGCSSVITESAGKAALRHQRQADVRAECPVAAAPISERNLRFVVDELVDNAMKFSRPGGRVVVTAVRIAQDFSLCVEDNGRGMTPDQIGRVGPFVQFDRDKFSHEGIGLGLATVQRIVELHGGRMKILPAEAGGCCVRVVIPYPNNG